MKGIQVKQFDDYDPYAIEHMNTFIKDKEVIDIKQNILKADTGSFYSQYLVIYKVKELEE